MRRWGGVLAGLLWLLGCRDNEPTSPEALAGSGGAEAASAGAGGSGGVGGKGGKGGKGGGTPGQTLPPYPDCTPGGPTTLTASGFEQVAGLAIRALSIAGSGGTCASFEKKGQVAPDGTFSITWGTTAANPYFLLFFVKDGKDFAECQPYDTSVITPEDCEEGLVFLEQPQP